MDFAYLVCRSHNMTSASPGRTTVPLVAILKIYNVLLNIY